MRPLQRTSSRRRGLLAAFVTVSALSLSACATTPSGWGPRIEDDAQRASLYRLTAKEIEKYSSARSVEELLEQHFSGFSNRTPDERPGAIGEAYLLGAAAPLFVVDGVPVQHRGSLGLNPQDVEVIELVKHGASAIYGMRGSAGAILITTKRH